MTEQNTNNDNNSNRLDRIEALVEANSQGIAENRQAIAEQRRVVSELARAAQAALSMSQNTRESLQQTEQLTRRNASAIARLEEKMEQYIVEGREHREYIATQVDGIKLETRRIIEHLFGEMDNE